MNMARTGVFVDAGYLFARGGAALSGGVDIKRARLLLDEHQVIEHLIAAANAYGVTARCCASTGTTHRSHAV